MLWANYLHQRLIDQNICLSPKSFCPSMHVLEMIPRKFRPYFCFIMLLSWSCLSPEGLRGVHFFSMEINKRNCMEFLNWFILPAIQYRGTHRHVGTVCGNSVVLLTFLYLAYRYQIFYIIGCRYIFNAYKHLKP